MSEDNHLVTEELLPQERRPCSYYSYYSYFPNRTWTPNILQLVTYGAGWRLHSEGFYQPEQEHKEFIILQERESLPKAHLWDPVGNTTFESMKECYLWRGSWGSVGASCFVVQYWRAEIESEWPAKTQTWQTLLNESK